ncbi:S9 family peptidase [Phytoactinopolyspora alkaliphila]|uniref:S9 family peptidase n=1 Tax=Phytoactinopolyspora alkaliphila TaxID=1783498 RepID=A0A6N9YQ39_9ACTN|nr:prolyl oligopeptidase family serine peptidase [Phytoactinopolyspora alkaliphila]NED96939.1 S9 family peptidase [Phytoactinopolyspora alkaliphila]
MDEQKTAPYGAWQSPIDARMVARTAGRPTWVSLHKSQPWWAEPMPAEGGRIALLRRVEGSPPAESGEATSPAQPVVAHDEVVLPPPWNVRSRVHEYGGRAYVLVPGDPGPVVVFAEFSDQRLYRYQPGTDETPRPLTPQPQHPAGLRYVEPVVAPGGQEVWCIREEHTGPAPTDVSRSIVAVPVDGSAADDPAGVQVLVVDTHFLACPRVAPDGRRLSWIGWDHPSMPWDSTVLRVARIGEGGTVHAPVTVAGGPDVAVVQAEWQSEDSLLYVADPTGWWNLHRVSVDVESGPNGEPVNLCPLEEEFGGPLWQLGMQWFAPLARGRVAVIHGRAATRLSVLDTVSGELLPLDDDHTEWAPTLSAEGSAVLGVAGGPADPYQVMMAATVGRKTLALTDPLYDGRSSPHTGESQLDAVALWKVSEQYSPEPEARIFTGAQGREVHANVYRPRNEAFAGPAGELPPYVVFVHGGPTSRVPMVHDLEVAYFTSRGIGVVEVNYGGSTGFGREYRNRLRHSWGVVDVEDCVAVARAMAGEGLADPARLAIRGGSAGGWTSAAALTFADTFSCGVIMYPILDLSGWRTGETHDFESQYLESLVGPWPEAEQRYRDRSPMNAPDRVSVPFLLLQGLEDEICPPVQAERYVQAMRGRGVAHAYLTFEGEQHGFRRDETIVAALEAELSLYSQVFGFDAPDVAPLELTR